MSFYVKIRCGSCRGIFDIYQEQMETKIPVNCPFCKTAVPEEQMNDLVKCFQGVVDWNKNAAKVAAEHGLPLFTAEIRRHFVNRQRSEG